MAEFRDRTGRPGPGTWEVGMYPAGQDDYPVTGVSWYEADAFARFSGRSLPTIYHWVRAAGVGQAAYITPLSNLNGKGPAPVGGHPGVSPVGAAGHGGQRQGVVRERGRGQRRALPARRIVARSGAHVHVCRRARAVRSLRRQRLPARRPISNAARRGADRSHCRCRGGTSALSAGPGSRSSPRSCELYAYDPRPLDAAVEARDESAAHWVREKVSFRAAYGNDRVPAYVFLPRHVQPPYQTVVYAPAPATVTQRRASTSAIGSPRGDFRAVDYVIQSGRAVVYPVYSGTYERNTGQTSSWPERTRAYQDWMIRIVNDARRAMEYLHSRADIRHDAVAFVGVSWGAIAGDRASCAGDALQDRRADGRRFSQSYEVPPPLDTVSYLPRVTLPTLMVNGNGDFIYPVEAGQKPFFDLLGTPRDQKSHVVLSAVTSSWGSSGVRS